MIREATTDDLPAIETLIRDGCEALGPDGMQRHSAIWAAVSAAVLDGQVLYVAQEGPSVVGVCGWVPYPGQPETVIGAGTFVHPAFQRRGIGRELRARAEEFWASQGARRILASVSASNVPGMRSLETGGFTVCGLEMQKILPQGGAA